MSIKICHLQYATAVAAKKVTYFAMTNMTTKTEPLICHGQIHLLSPLTKLVSRYATCAEKLAKNKQTKKSNIERHFQSKQTTFAEKKYAAGDERRRVISES